jgi:hypothetical protein
MGNCSAKQVIQPIQDIVGIIISLERNNDSAGVYKHLLTMLYNLQQYTPEQQLIILELVKEKLS